MDQNGQAKSSETAPPAYFTEAMKRYARRVFGAYNPVTGKRDQYYEISNPFTVIRSVPPSDPSQNRKNKRQIIRIGNNFFVYSYSKTLPIRNYHDSNQGTYLKFSFIESDGRFKLCSIDFFVRFPKKSISFEEMNFSRECKKWKDLGVIQNNNILNPGFARYVITHPDFFGFHSVDKIIDDYAQKKSPLFNVREPEGENDPGEFADSCFAEIDWLDYGHFIMARNSDVKEFKVNPRWREIKHEDVDQIKIINKSIPGRKETAQILEYFLSLKDGSHIEKSKMKTAAFQIASRIATDQISVEYPPKNEKIFGDAENTESAESTEADLLSRISTQLNSLKIDFI